MQKTMVEVKKMVEITEKQEGFFITAEEARVIRLALGNTSSQHDEENFGLVVAAKLAQIFDQLGGLR